MSWLTSAEAAAHTKRHQKTVIVAAAKGDLHGVQRVAPQGSWRFRTECLDAWVAGEKCEHQENVRKLRAS